MQRQGSLGKPPRPQGGGSRASISADIALAEAAANGQTKLVTKLLEESKANVNAPGKDGTTPLCAAALWGDAAMVRLLLSHGANPNVKNTGTLWTPLHAAAFQEHGKVVHLLLSAQADPTSPDHKGRTPADYATIAPGIWPFFQAKGCSRTAKAELVDKGIIRRAVPPPSPMREHGKVIRTGSGRALIPGADGPPSSGSSGGSYMPVNAIRELSRPGSSYVRVAYDPRRPGSAVGDKVGRPQGGYRPIGFGAGAGAGAGAGGGGSVDPIAHLAVGRGAGGQSRSSNGGVASKRGGQQGGTGVALSLSGLQL